MYFMSSPLGANKFWHFNGMTDKVRNWNVLRLPTCGSFIYDYDIRYERTIVEELKLCACMCVAGSTVCCRCLALATLYVINIWPCRTWIELWYDFVIIRHNVDLDARVRFSADIKLIYFIPKSLIINFSFNFFCNLLAVEIYKLAVDGNSSNGSNEILVIHS